VYRKSVTRLEGADDGHDCSPVNNGYGIKNLYLAYSSVGLPDKLPGWLKNILWCVLLKIYALYFYTRDSIFV
jgi:hypothetical protein